MLCVKTTPQPLWPAADSMACDEQEEPPLCLAKRYMYFWPREPAFWRLLSAYQARYKSQLIRVPRHAMCYEIGVNKGFQRIGMYVDVRLMQGDFPFPNVGRDSM